MIREEFRQEEHLWRQVYVKMEMISEKYCQEQKFTQNSVVLHKEVTLKIRRKSLSQELSETTSPWPRAT